MLHIQNKNGDIITFAQFEEENLLPETCKDTGKGNKYDDYLTLELLISEAEMDDMLSGDESDAEPMCMDMLEDIYDGSKYHLSINRREDRYKIRDNFKQGQA